MLKKLKELSKDTAVYGVSTMIGRFLGFLLFPIYTNVFSPTEYGHFTVVYAYLAFLNVVYIYGMDAAFMKYTSLATADEKKATFSTPYLFVATTTVIFSIIFYLFLHPISEGINLPIQYSYLLIYVIFILLFDTLSLIPFNSLRLERKTQKFTLIKITNIIINLALNVVLILGYGFGIESIFISNLVASIFSFVVLLPEISQKLSFSINFIVLKKMLKFGIPYLAAAFTSMIVQVIDVPIVEKLTNTATLGIYRANYRLGIFMMLFVQMFNYAWQPFFLTNAKEENAKEIFSKVFTLFLIASAIIWAFLSLFVENIVQIEIAGRTLLGREFLSGLPIIPIILLAYLFNGLYMNFTAGIYIEEKTKYFPIVTISGALVNVIVNFTLIPILGIMGAAWATLASYIVMAVGLFIVSQKFYKIDYEYIKILKIFLIIAITSAIYYFYKEVMNLEIKILVFIMFLIELFVLRVIKKDEILRTLKSFKKIKV
ncbi:MAG: oligosaccharide flippase family protein [Bacteroidetes bacterium]|nr:oligosaccharide flippase family protein [Bacteroidota bacterium]MBU1115960.1 oligosaccharide flippase family protein [Bacteroidota bacterium]MBU1798443.1 oligosaccharide flippase family protein [Bacteroidota bacterium]